MFDTSTASSFLLILLTTSPPLGGSQNLCSLVLRGQLSKASHTRRSGLFCWGSAHLRALKGIAEEPSLIELPLETNKQTNKPFTYYGVSNRVPVPYRENVHLKKNFRTISAKTNGLNSSTSQRGRGPSQQ